SAACAQLCGGARQPVVIAAVENHGGTSLRQTASDGEAEAAGGTGHQRTAAGEGEIREGWHHERLDTCGKFVDGGRGVDASNSTLRSPPRRKSGVISRMRAWSRFVPV